MVKVRKNQEVKFNIKKKIGVISRNADSGWTKEINLVSWNNGEPVYDIRSWSPKREKAGKGVTMTKAEVVELLKILEGFE